MRFVLFLFSARALFSSLRVSPLPLERGACALFSARALPFLPVFCPPSRRSCPTGRSQLCAEKPALLLPNGSAIRSRICSSLPQATRLKPTIRNRRAVIGTNRSRAAACAGDRTGAHANRDRVAARTDPSVQRANDGASNNRGKRHIFTDIAHTAGMNTEKTLQAFGTHQTRHNTKKGEPLFTKAM